MTLARGKLADIQYVPSAAAAILTNGSSQKKYIRSITLFNGNTTAETVKLYNVPDSAGAVGTAGVSNQFFEYPMAAKETYTLEWAYPITLTDANDTLQAVTTTASKVTVMLHGDSE